MKKTIGLLIFIFAAKSAFAFTLTSSSNPNMRGWNSSDVQLYVNTTNCPWNVDVPTLIADAAAVWNNVPTSTIKVSYGGSTTSTTSSSPITVYCEVNFGSVTKANQNYVPGAALPDTSLGYISKGIMYLNASSGTANIGNFNQTILKVILAHEIGHLLGLGHSDSTSALMYYDASEKANLSLSQDDIDGISYLYPSDEFSNSKFAGCGTVSAPKPPSSKNLMMLALLFLLPLGVYLSLRLRKSPQAA